MNHCNTTIVTVTFKLSFQISITKVFCKLYSYDSCAKSKNVRIVMLFDQTRGCTVATNTCTNAFYFICSN